MNTRTVRVWLLVVQSKAQVGRLPLLPCNAALTTLSEIDMAPVIVISSMHRSADTHSHWFSAVRNTYSEAVARCGATPVIAPLTADERVWRALFEMADGILLSGGDDIHPELYDESLTDNHKLECNRRDSMECALARWAHEEAKPLLGVCRGMQVMNVVNGGCLHSSLCMATYGAHDERPRLGGHAWEEVVDRVFFEAGSVIKAAVQTDSLPVNSLHRQGIREIGKGLKATGWSESGLIEVIESSTGHPFYVGVQFHPEALCDQSVPEWQRLFDGFVRAASE